MIRDPDTLAALLDNVARFVRERLVPNESEVERFCRDVRRFRIYEGTSQILQLSIARNMIREARQ
jgi:alkylation response protein AidB-like acyl-CoA dehydrogenase